MGAVNKDKNHDSRISVNMEFGFFMFAVGLTIVFFTIGFISIAYWTVEESGNDNSVSRAKRSLETTCVTQGCNVDCNSVEFEYLANAIEIASQSCSSISRLALVKISFPNKIIPKNWLEGISKSILQLVIQDCFVMDIEATALVDAPLHQLNNLQLIDTGIEYLQQHFFDGMNAVNEIAVRFDKSFQTNFKIEKGVFDGASILSALTLQGCLSNGEQVFNVTGVGTLLSKLAILNFGYNAITDLVNNSFVGAQILQNLVLVGNKIKTIEKNAFSSTSLKQVNISLNSLKFVEEGTFDYILDNNVRLSVGGNPWDCNCQLEWFKKYYLDPYNKVDTNYPPKCDLIYDFEEVEFCPSTTSTQETTTPSTTVPSTLPPKKYKELNCVVDHAKVKLEKAEFIQKVQLIDSNLTFTFYDVDSNFKTIVEISGEYQLYNLMWFNSINTEETGCISLTTLETNVVALDQLKRGEQYTLCLMTSEETSVSPYACFGIQILEEWEYRTWIPNGDKILSICISVTVLLICILVSVFITFLCIRQHPKLIKGNKRVIIVRENSKSTEAIVMPKSFDSKAVEQYMTTSGYITPIYNKIMTPAGLYYVTPEINVEPPSRRTTNEDFFEEQAYGCDEEFKDHPPPLPPLNPNQLSIYEDIYSAV